MPKASNFSEDRKLLEIIGSAIELGDAQFAWFITVSQAWSRPSEFIFGITREPKDVVGNLVPRHAVSDGPLQYCRDQGAPMSALRTVGVRL